MSDTFLDLPTTGTTEIINCHDTDEAQEAAGRIYYPHTTQVLGTDSFRLNVNVTHLGAITLGWLDYSTEVNVETGPLTTAYHVNVPVGGKVRTASGGDRVLATARNAALYRVDRNTQFWGWDEPCRMLAVKIDREALENELSLMLGRQVDGPIDFPAAFDLREGRAKQWWSLAEALSKDIGSPNLLMMHPLLRDSLARNLVSGLLLAAGHKYRTFLDAPDDRTPNPSSVCFAVEYIEEHATEPLTVGDIAFAAGVGVRSLQQNFRSALDTTPLMYLRKVRLARVRTELLSSDPQVVGVSEVAYRWGFAHLGRFAQQYRGMYNENPSESLRRFS